MSTPILPRWVYAFFSTALAIVVLAFLFIVSPTPVTAQSNLITSHTFTITETGKYQITLQCKDGFIRYDVEGGNVLYTKNVYCPVSDYFTTFSTPLLNLPPQTYVISFYEEGGDPVIGTTTSTRGGDVTDIDSGILANGGFFQDSNWTYLGAHYKPDLGRTELGAANVLTLTSAQQQIQITEEGIYQYQLYCHGDGAAIKVSLVGEGLPIPGTGSGHFLCGGKNPITWKNYTSPDFYLAQGTYTITLQGNNRNSKLILVDDIGLVKKDSVGHLDTGLIRNGDFFTHDEWLWDNQNNYTITSGSFALGAAKLFSSKKIRQGNIVIPSTGSYVLGVDCYSAYYSPTFIYKLESPGQSPTQATVSCSHRSWVTKLMTHTLTAGTYTLTLYSTNSATYELMVDDISLFPAALHDIDTGYIQNGDFVGPSAWALEGNVEYESKLGHTERGTLYFPNTAGQVVTQSLGSLEAGDYNLTLFCSNYRAGRPGSLEVLFTTEEDTILNTTINCSADLSSTWITNTLPIILPASVSTATLVISHTDGTGVLPVYLDDVQMWDACIPQGDDKLKICVRDAEGNPVTELALNEEGWPMYNADNPEVVANPLRVEVYFNCPVGGGDCLGELAELGFGSLINEPFSRLYWEDSMTITPTLSLTKACSEIFSEAYTFSYQQMAFVCYDNTAMTTLSLSEGEQFKTEFDIWVQPSDVNTIHFKATWGEEQVTAFPVLIPQAQIQPAVFLHGNAS